VGLPSGAASGRGPRLLRNRLRREPSRSSQLLQKLFGRTRARHPGTLEVLPDEPLLPQSTDDKCAPSEADVRRRRACRRSAFQLHPRCSIAKAVRRSSGPGSLGESGGVRTNRAGASEASPPREHGSEREHDGASRRCRAARAVGALVGKGEAERVTCIRARSQVAHRDVLTSQFPVELLARFHPHQAPLDRSSISKAAFAVRQMGLFAAMPNRPRSSCERFTTRSPRCTAASRAALDMPLRNDRVSGA
jgi:hypothetical protein